jgi:hypothetical protein
MILSPHDVCVLVLSERSPHLVLNVHPDAKREYIFKAAGRLHTAIVDLRDKELKARTLAAITEAKTAMLAKAKKRVRVKQPRFIPVKTNG